MNILYLHQHFALREGSKGIRSYEFSRLLFARGHTITMVCGAYESSGMNQDQQGMISTITLPEMKVLRLNVPYGQKMSYPRRIAAFIWFALLSSLIAARQGQAEVILATSTPLTIGIPALVAGLLRRKPFVFEVRDLWPEVPIAVGILRNRWLIGAARWLEKLIYQRAAHIIALSPGMKEGIIKIGIPPEKITVIPNSCDNELFEVPPEAGAAFRAAHPFVKDRPIVLYAGALGFINNLSYLLQIAEQLFKRKDDALFLIVGGGSEAAKLEAEARARGIWEQNLWILGQMPHAQIPTVFSAAAISTSFFLNHETMWVNSANKFFDSLAAGRPIAINYGGWQADLLRETGAGVVLSPDNPSLAADQLAQVLHDPNWLKNASEAAKKLAIERFARDKLVLLMEQTLQKAASKAH
ncbi:MAG: glycosyltransferase family 4 protein [Anaerolinea sp.]|nr:glycosyltransferase family 4 protein [Anaerolinea sp.]CAG0971929.1 Alpha-D-kanosaminyltransferase [Anaerolineae bacterium]